MMIYELLILIAGVLAAFGLGWSLATKSYSAHESAVIDHQLAEIMRLRNDLEKTNKPRRTPRKKYNPRKKSTPKKHIRRTNNKKK